MPSGYDTGGSGKSKKKVNAKEARREQAMAQIMTQLQGAFGDYVRAQTQGAPAQQMAAPPPSPSHPMPPPGGGGLISPNGGMIPPMTEGMAAPNVFHGNPQYPDPGFSPPLPPSIPQQQYEDGSRSMMPMDPGFAPQMPRGPIPPPPQFPMPNPAQTGNPLLDLLAMLQGRR